MTVVLTLRRDWDLALQPPQPGKPALGHFVGRSRELDLLTNEILRSTQRSLFVAGYRGVGKTSLVYAALHAVRESASTDHFLFVLLNAAQLEAESAEGDRIDPRAILENLIRRLYTASREYPLSDDLRARIDALYRKAAASEFEERFTSGREDVLRELEERSIDVGTSGSAQSATIWSLSFLVAAVVAAVPWDAGALDNFLPLIIAVPLPITLQFALRWKRQRTKTREIRDSASTLYSFDKSLGNLEFDLESIQRDLAADTRTVVYVIDELDKIADPERVVQVLRFFKNLFTLSAAIFIFVGSEELASRFQHEAGAAADVYREMEYTYFTSQYFIARPEPEDLSRYLDQVVFSVGLDPNATPKASSVISRRSWFSTHALISSTSNVTCGTELRSFLKLYR